MSDIKNAVNAISKATKKSIAAAKKLEKAIKKREREKAKAAKLAEKLRKEKEKEEKLLEKLKSPEGKAAVVKKYNQRLEKLKQKFGEDYVNKEVLPDLLTDPNIKLDDNGKIDAAKSIIDRDTVSFLDDTVLTTTKELDKYKDDERIQQAIESKGLTDIKDIRREIAAQVVSMHTVTEESFKGQLDHYYHVVRPEVQSLAKDAPIGIDVLPTTEYDDLNEEINIARAQFEEEYNSIIDNVDEMKGLDNDIDVKLSSSGLKSWTELQDISHDMSLVEQLFIETESRLKSYNRSITKFVSAIEAEVSKRKGV